MTKNLKAALAVLGLALVSGAGALALKHHHDNSPYLVGHCFVDTEQGVGLAIVDSRVLKTQDGKDVQAYLTEIVLGPISLNGPALAVSEANKELAKGVAEGKLEEVNCENGQPIKN